MRAIQKGKITEMALYLIIFIAFCLLVEQIVCALHMPYLGRFGIIISSRIGKISITSVESVCLHAAGAMKLSAYKDTETIFLKNRYPYHTLWLGPCVCAARIVELEKDTVRIDVTMCPLLFFAFAAAVTIALVGFALGVVAGSVFLGICLNLLLWFCGMYLYYTLLTTKIACLFLQE